MSKKMIFAYAIALTAFSMASNSAVTTCSPPQGTVQSACDTTGKNCFAVVQKPFEVRGYFTKGNCEWKPSSRHPGQFTSFLYLNKLKCKDDFSTCIIVGNTLTATPIYGTAYVTVTHDGGQNWDSLETGTECNHSNQGHSFQSSGFYDVDTDPTGKNWIAAGWCLYPDTGGAGGYVKLSQDGFNWRNAKTQPISPGSRSLRKVNCNKESRVCIADNFDDNGRFISTDAGENWFFIGQ